jgi:predicted acylesterase/phospholipase RssA
MACSDFVTVKYSARLDVHFHINSSSFEVYLDGSGSLPREGSNVNWKQIGRLLRTLFLLRVPLFTLVLLAAITPIGLWVAKTLLGNLFDERILQINADGKLSTSVGWTAWNLFIISFAAFLAAFTAVAVINLILHYGRDRFDNPALSLGQKRPLVTFFSGIAAALPLVIGTAVHSRGDSQHTNDGSIFWLMPVLGFLGALVLVFFAKIVQLVFTSPKTTKHPPPYLIFPVYKIHALERIFDVLYCWKGNSISSLKGGINRISQWPLEILRCAGEGYLIDCRAARGNLALRSGHVFALALSLMAFATYLGIGYAKGKIDAQPTVVPALAFLLLFGIVMCWTLGALTFFLDRYRVPLFSGVAILSLITIFAPQSDHIYRLEARPTPDRIDPTSLVRKRTGEGKKRIILVATAGGGIQAAAWTARVLRGLEEECGQLSSPSGNPPLCNFRDSVVLISGVSGGSLGAIAYARSFTDFPTPMDSSQVPYNAAHPALDEVAWAWMNPDVGRAILPWFRTQYVDRGWALEEKWAAVNKTYVPAVTRLVRLLSTDRGKETWLGDWAKETEERTMPALLLNATLVEEGRPLVFSSTDFPRENDPRGLINFYDRYRDSDIRVTTAARLSASFPYVAPAARADTKAPTVGDDHVVDGGYYDNYGITSLLGWLQDVIDDPKSQDIARGLEDVLILQIRPFADSGPAALSPKGWGYQLIAPVNALLNVRDTGQSARDRTELALFTRAHQQKTRIWRADFFYPSKFTKDDQKCADTPLSWKLSLEQTNCILAAWKDLVAGDKASPGQGRIGCVAGYLQNKPISKDSKTNPGAAICTAGDAETQ